MNKKNIVYSTQTSQSDSVTCGDNGYECGCIDL